MTKIDIFSGFLGAGKTTLIKKLLKEALHDTKVVLIENEFGEIGIDGGFLKESGIEIKEMNSGCICCSLVGDFGTFLKEGLSSYAPERILIEPSGVGKLSDVVKAVDDVAKDMDVQVNSAVAVVDATKCKMYIKNFGEFFCNQIACAGTIILSRTQNMSEDKLKTCIDMIREYNKEATIITTPWEALQGEDILKTIEGADKLEDMIAAIDDGYYFTQTNNGQADTTGEFMFGIMMGYEIKNGKLGRAVRDTTISGVAFQMLQTVDMLSDDMVWSCSGTCGKKQPMPVGMGGPAVKCKVNVAGK